MFHTVNELATHIKSLIDAYWRLDKSEQGLTKEIKEAFDNPVNCRLALRGMTFSATFEQRIGKKRTKYLKQLLNQIDSNRFHFI